MTTIAIYNESGSGTPTLYQDFETIEKTLDEQGVQFERWSTEATLSEDAGQEEVLSAYQQAVEKLNDKYGFKSVDVVAITPDHPDKQVFREKFLAEHTHEDFEIRFFVEGSGLFYLHIESNVYVVLCEKGDLISVPAKTTHWFDMGTSPYFKCIRFFITPDGWEGNFTDSDIADQFPSYDEFIKSIR